MLFLCLVTGITKLSAQVAINTDGSPPDSSAMLDVQSSDRGFLPPRVALVSADSDLPVTNPATGLLVFNTATSGTSVNRMYPGIYWWNGHRWNRASIDTPFPALPDNCEPYGTVTDYDGNAYPTVMIGTHEWMAQNLKVLHDNNGQMLRYAYDNAEYSLAANGPTVCDVNFNDQNREQYGLIYRYDHDFASLCPEGWYMPTTVEWNELINHLGGSAVAGGKMKATGTEYWYPPNTGASNESCFSAISGRFVTLWPPLCLFESSPQYAYFYSYDFPDMELYKLVWNSTEIIYMPGWELVPLCYSGFVRCVRLATSGN